MKTYLPYVYAFAFVPPKRVRPIVAHSGGTIEVEVPEISLAETGLAASLEYIIERPRQTVVMPAEFRTWNGSLLARVGDESFPVFKTSWLPTEPGGRSRMPSAKPLYGFVMGDGQRVEKYFWGDEGAVDYHEPPIGEVTWSHQGRDHTIVKRLADDLVSVDGELWRKTGFAALCLDVRPPLREGAPLWASFVQKPFGYFPFARDTAESRRFPATRKMFDVSQAERLVRHAGPSGAGWHFRSLVVHDPDALAFDGERDFIKDAMDYAVLTTESAVGEMSASAVVAWSSTRSAVDRVTTTGDDFTDGEIEAFRMLASEYSGENTDMIRKCLAGCEEYMNDPWGRYGSRSAPAREIQTAGL
ncbi:hypothetical protein HFN89_01630 [Rhizobium laguerreae]|nr:hypothetical protein [Rhizobium laguerreae]